MCLQEAAILTTMIRGSEKTSLADNSLPIKHDHIRVVQVHGDKYVEVCQQYPLPGPKRCFEFLAPVKGIDAPNKNDRVLCPTHVTDERTALFLAPQCFCEQPGGMFRPLQQTGIRCRGHQHRSAPYIWYRMRGEIVRCISYSIIRLNIRFSLLLCLQTVAEEHQGSFCIHPRTEDRIYSQENGTWTFSRILYGRLGWRSSFSSSLLTAK